jgi:hypothetical protein
MTLGDDHTGQVPIHAFGSPHIQPAHRDDDVRATPSNDCELHSEALKDMGHRRGSRKSTVGDEFVRKDKDGRKADSIGNNERNKNSFIQNPLGQGFLSCPVQPWAYYPPPAFMVMMPVPVIPMGPMFGPSQWTNIDSGNVTNIHMYDSANNNSTNSRITKSTGFVLHNHQQSLMCFRSEKERREAQKKS